MTEEPSGQPPPPQTNPRRRKKSKKQQQHLSEPELEETTEPRPIEEAIAANTSHPTAVIPQPSENAQSKAPAAKPPGSKRRNRSASNKRRRQAKKNKDRINNLKEGASVPGGEGQCLQKETEITLSHKEDATEVFSTPRNSVLIPDICSVSLERLSSSGNSNTSQEKGASTSSNHNIESESCHSEKDIFSEDTDNNLEENCTVRNEEEDIFSTNPNSCEVIISDDASSSLQVVGEAVKENGNVNNLYESEPVNTARPCSADILHPAEVSTAATENCATDDGSVSSPAEVGGSAGTEGEGEVTRGQGGVTTGSCQTTTTAIQPCDNQFNVKPGPGGNNLEEVDKAPCNDVEKADCETSEQVSTDSTDASPGQEIVSSLTSQSDSLCAAPPPPPPPLPPQGFLTENIKVPKIASRADRLKEREAGIEPTKKKKNVSREQALLDELAGFDNSFASFLKTQLNIKTGSRERDGGETATLERRKTRRRKTESESSEGRPGSALDKKKKSDDIQQEKPELDLEVKCVPEQSVDKNSAEQKNKFSEKLSESDQSYEAEFERSLEANTKELPGAKPHVPVPGPTESLPECRVVEDMPAKAIMDATVEESATGHSGAVFSVSGAGQETATATATPASMSSKHLLDDNVDVTNNNVTPGGSDNSYCDDKEALLVGEASSRGTQVNNTMGGNNSSPEVTDTHSDSTLTGPSIPPTLSKSDSGYSGSSPKATKKKELSIDEAMRLYNRRLGEPGSAPPSAASRPRHRLQSGTDYSEYSESESELSDNDGKNLVVSMYLS